MCVRERECVSERERKSKIYPIARERERERSLSPPVGSTV